MSTIASNIPGFSGEPIGAAAIFSGAEASDTVITGADPMLVLERLNALLRGEISAAETYRNVLAKTATSDHPENHKLLRDLQADHGRACQKIRERVVELGGTPADSSGVWGVWAQVVQGTLSLFGGDRGGLRALLEGEDHGLKDYQSALNEVDPTSAQLIQNMLIPGQQGHIEILDNLLASPN